MQRELVRPPQPLRLLVLDDVEDGPAAPLSLDSTLREFFELWFLPIALRGELRAKHTVLGYQVTLDWWDAITGGPPLKLIDDFTVSQFAAGLRQATFRRGRLGQARPLSLESISRHLRNLRALLNRVGPQRDRDQVTAGLVDRGWRVKVPRFHPQPQDCFSLEQAATILSAAHKLDVPGVAGIAPGQWWTAFCSWLYVTDLRVGTVRRLEWPMLVQKPEGWWLEIPRELVPKTGKGKWVALPQWAMAGVASWPRHGPAIFPWPRSKDQLLICFKRLQQLAGCQRLLPLKAWRRTHAREMQRLGASWAIEISRRSLDHSDSATTIGHYADITEELRRKLPPLLAPQRLLFSV